MTLLQSESTSFTCDMAGDPREIDDLLEFEKPSDTDDPPDTNVQREEDVPSELGNSPSGIDDRRDPDNLPSRLDVPMTGKSSAPCEPTMLLAGSTNIGRL